MASRSLSSIRLNVRLSSTLTNTLDDATTAAVSHPALNYAPSLSNGVSAGEANRVWQSNGRSISSGGQETLDIFDFASVDIGVGDGKDGVGLAMTMEEIVAIGITNENAIGAAGQLEIIPASSEGWQALGSHTVANGGALYGQGLLFKAQPAEAAFDVTTVRHRIAFRAVGGDVSYSVYLIARHDDAESSSSSSSSVSSSSSSSQSSSLSSSSVSSSSQSSSSSSLSASSSSSSSISTSSLSSSSISTSSQSTSSSSSSSSSSQSTSSQSTSSSSSSSESSSSLSSQS